MRSYDIFNPFIQPQPRFPLIKRPAWMIQNERTGFEFLTDPLYWIKNPGEYYWTKLYIRSMYIHGKFKYLDECYKEYIMATFIKEFKEGSNWDYDFIQVVDWKKRNSTYGSMNSRDPIELLTTDEIKNHIRMYNIFYRYKMHRVV